MQCTLLWNAHRYAAEDHWSLRSRRCNGPRIVRVWW